ncbi:MAG: transglutaminase-like cysteine peptidase [Pseudomonadales bacterium]
MPVFASYTRQRQPRQSYVAWVLLGALLATLASANPLGITDKILDAIAMEYGRRARGRILAWQHLVESSSQHSERDKLTRVNDFFNQVQFVSDQAHWQKIDYWATPIELLATQGGDCEDFAIAKYITLRALDVPDEKLRITYVKALELNQAHMVLTFYETPGAMPEVLDNLDPAIKPADQRPDLQPVYSFNGNGLWLAKMRGEGQKLGSANDLNMWRDLVARLNRERNS